MEIQQESFQSSLNEPDSSKFRERAADIESVFEPYFRSRFPGFQQIIIEGFFNGSSGLGFRYRLLSMHHQMRRIPVLDKLFEQATRQRIWHFIH